MRAISADSSQAGNGRNCWKRYYIIKTSSRVFSTSFSLVIIDIWPRVGVNTPLTSRLTHRNHELFMIAPTMCRAYAYGVTFFSVFKYMCTHWTFNIEKNCLKKKKSKNTEIGGPETFLSAIIRRMTYEGVGKPSCDQTVFWIFSKPQWHIEKHNSYEWKNKAREF